MIVPDPDVMHPFAHVLKPRRRGGAQRACLPEVLLESRSIGAEHEGRHPTLIVDAQQPAVLGVGVEQKSVFQTKGTRTMGPRNVPGDRGRRFTRHIAHPERVHHRGKQHAGVVEGDRVTH